MTSDLKENSAILSPTNKSQKVPQADVLGIVIYGYEVCLLTLILLI